MNVKDSLRHQIGEALKECAQSGELSQHTVPPFTLETPKAEQHGDFATNVAMLLAPREKKSPRAIAQSIVSRLSQKDDRIFEKLEVAGPGFINFFISRPFWLAALKDMALQGDGYGTSNIGRGEKIMVEYVSANPTGPLHIGHGRGAAIGDALANILQAAEAAGAEVIATECPTCHSGLEMHQIRAESALGLKTHVKIIYFTQLLGLALGLKPKAVGLHENVSDSFAFVKEKGLA